MKKLFVLLTVTVLLTGCDKSNSESAAGIAISFDDRYVKQWYQLSEMLAKYDARVTFFVTKFDSLNPTELKMLEVLEAKGHEIGSHGYLHVEAENYIKNHSWGKYIKDEVVANKIAMESSGFDPKSFAYPYGSKYWFTDYLILKHHKAVRSDVPLNKSKNLAAMDEIFYSIGTTKEFYSIGFDEKYGLTNEMIKRGIKRAAENNEILVMHAHVPDSGQEGKYKFSIKTLEFILKTAQTNNLKFYRFNDMIENK